MKLEKDEHINKWYLHFGGDKGIVSLINDWEQLFGSYNWYSFHVFHCYFEKEVAWGKSYEFSFALAGLGFTIRYTASISEELQARIDESTKEIKEKLEFEIIPSPRIDYCGACDAEHGYECPREGRY